MRNKLVLDAYDAVIVLCERHIESIDRVLQNRMHVAEAAALGGKRTALNQVKDFCEAKKQNENSTT